MDNSKVLSITCGILFNRSFRIMDMWGSIVDHTLRSSGWFSSEYFPNISSQYTLQGELSNPEKGHYLRLSTENLVYCHVFQNNYEEEYNTFCQCVTKFLVPSIIHSNNLVTRRLGVVYGYELTDNEINQIAARYFKPEIKGIGDFRFSRREATPKGAMISGTSDFINKIYTVGNIERGKQGISYDYQHHYVPPQSCIVDKIEKFLNAGNNEFAKDIDLGV